MKQEVLTLVSGLRALRQLGIRRPPCTNPSSQDRFYRPEYSKQSSLHIKRVADALPPTNIQTVCQLCRNDRWSNFCIENYFNVSPLSTLTCFTDAPVQSFESQGSVS